jgi:hypothetical protein
MMGYSLLTHQFKRERGVTETDCNDFIFSRTIMPVYNDASGSFYSPIIHFSCICENDHGIPSRNICDLVARRNVSVGRCRNRD